MSRPERAQRSVESARLSEFGTGGELVLAVLFGAGAVVSAWLTIVVLSDEEFGRATARTLAGLLIGGLITFLFGIVAVVAIFKALALHQPDQPLGLPEGSIQAFIALFLILLFFVMSVFLYLNVAATSEDRVLTGLTQDQVDSLVQETIVARVPFSVQIPDPDNPDGPDLIETRFDVVVAGPNQRSDVADEIARYLVTTIGTLVVAIAAFYFGAKGTGPPEPNGQAGAGGG